MYVNPPTSVASLRTMVFACAVVVSAGYAVGQYHFPSAAPLTSDGAAGDAIPLFEVEEEDEDNSNSLAGGGVLPNGTLSLTFCADMDAGQIVQFCRTLASQLRAMQTGLPITSATAGPASGVTLGAEAAQDSPGAPASQIAYRSCTIRITYGLTY
jgi:hypothetical protein